MLIYFHEFIFYLRFSRFIIFIFEMYDFLIQLNFKNYEILF